MNALILNFILQQHRSSSVYLNIFDKIQQIFLSVLCTYFCIPEIVLVWRGEARLENDYSAQCFIIANGTYNNLYKQ